MELSCFKKEIRVTYADCDLRGRMTLGAILREAQQIGAEHCDAVGLTPERMGAAHAAFLLVKASIEPLRDLHEREHLTLVTEAAAPVHASYQRYTTFYDDGGTPVLAIDSHWALADTVARRVLRRPPEALGMPFFGTLTKQQELRLVRPKTLTDAGSAAAVYSRVDRNGHLNNTCYADIFCDLLPAAVWQGERGFCKAVLAYHTEVPYGETMTLALGQADYFGAPSWYLEGVRDGRRCFEGNLLF